MEFSPSQMFVFVVRAILTIAFPFICIFIARKKFDGRIFPFVIGLVAVNLLVIPRALLRDMLMPDSGDFTMRLVLSSLIGAFCEETARFLMFRYMLKNYDALTDAVCYGI
ncbi:MAG: YhfC family intramembrane metalloprotease, partial [Oscillospiraceae bacterium]|nr:YhfC family intramembrane metalloprotease [Oscillospiraceae bacterium]